MKWQGAGTCGATEEGPGIWSAEKEEGSGRESKLEHHQKSDQSKPVLVGFIQDTVFFFLLFLSNPKRKRKLPDHWL